jgi:capsid protein
MASKSLKKKTAKPVIKAPKTPAVAGGPAPKQQAYVEAGSSYPQNPRWESVTQSNARQILYMGANVDARRDLRSRDRNTMVKKCRYAERNYGLYNQILNDTVMYVVGGGMRMQAHCDDAEISREHMDYFYEVSRKLDITGRFSFEDCQKLITRAWMRDGDTFAAKVRNGRDEARIQLIEAHRVGDPADRDTPDRTWDGVLFGDFGEIVGYFVYRSDGSSRLMPANTMMHIVDFNSSSASRGTPLLQHSINSLQDIDEILSAEVRAVKDQSEVTRVLNKAGGFIDDNMAAELGGGDRCYNGMVEQAGGKLIVLEPNEKLEHQESKRPSQTFNGFIAELQRDVTFGSLPWDFVVDPSKLSGAGVRLAGNKADRFISHVQQMVINQFCIPTYQYIISDGIAKGLIRDDRSWYKCSVITPPSLTVDAGREAQSDREDIKMGLMSRAEYYKTHGTEFYKQIDSIAEEIAYIRRKEEELGLPYGSISQTYPNPVTPEQAQPAGTPPPSNP